MAAALWLEQISKSRFSIRQSHLILTLPFSETCDMGRWPSRGFRARARWRWMGLWGSQGGRVCDYSVEGFKRADGRAICYVG